MSGISEERIKEIYDSFQDSGRPLEEILASKGSLRGAEAQKLRGHFSSYQLNPAHCDNFELVAALMVGRKAKLEEMFEELVRTHGGDRRRAAMLWSNYRDSPNKLPIFDILQVGAFSQLVRDGAIGQAYYDALEYLISLGIDVDGEDVAGYTALQHSLTCTPLVTDFRWSSLLLAACADPIASMNHRNRYGATATHEQMMTFNRPGEEDIRAAALEFSLARGANVDIPDGDGSTARRTAARHPRFLDIMDKYDPEISINGGCNFCRRGGLIRREGQAEFSAQGERIKARLRCSRCKAAFYCSPVCQKMDWLNHRSICTPPEVWTDLK